MLLGSLRSTGTSNQGGMHLSIVSLQEWLTSPGLSACSTYMIFPTVRTDSSHLIHSFDRWQHLGKKDITASQDVAELECDMS
jgi:hypothetical protein